MNPTTLQFRLFAAAILGSGVFGCQILLTGCGGASAASSPSPTPNPTPSASPSPSPVPGPSPNPSPSPAPSPSPSPTATPSPTPTSPALASRFVYAIVDFEADGGFFGGMIDAGTGKVSPVPGNPFANSLGQNIVIHVLTDPQGRFFYALNIGASSFGEEFGKPGIDEYQINSSTGVLTPVANGPLVFTSGFHDSEMAIDGNGKFLYEPNGTGTDIYSIDQSTGLLTLVVTSSTAVPVGTFSAASPDGRFYFNAGTTGNSGNGTVEAFSINEVNGQLTLAAPPIPTGGSGGPIAVSLDSSLLFVANATQGTLAVFNIAAGGLLTPVSGSPFTIDAQAEAMSLSPNGKFLYITFGTPSQSHVQGYAVNASGSAVTVTAISGAALTSATSINVDSSGKFAYVSQSQLVTYAIDPTTGALTATSQTSEPLTDNPVDIALAP